MTLLIMTIIIMTLLRTLKMSGITYNANTYNGFYLQMALLITYIKNIYVMLHLLML